VQLPEKADEIETGEESNDHKSEQPEEIQQKLLPSQTNYQTSTNTSHFRTKV
jgi:hypothetical protein